MLVCECKNIKEIFYALQTCTKLLQMNNKLKVNSS